MDDTIKTFSTGEFAQRFGVKKDTLLYYDRIGLFQPAGVKENGYRYYTVPQLDVFWMLQSLKDLKFPLKTLEHYISSPSPEELIALSKEQMARIEEELQRLQQIHWLLQNMASYTEEALNAPLDTLRIETLPEQRIVVSEPFPYSDGFTEKDWFEFTDAFLKSKGIRGPAFVGSVISQEDLLQQRYGQIHRLFVRSDRSDATLRPAGCYAVLYHKGTFDSPQAAYEPIVRSIQEQGYEICGDAYEEYLLDKLAVSDASDFMIKLSLPVQPCKCNI